MLFNYNGTKYTYVLNLQGDIVALLDVNGATMVEYKYDAWGKSLSIAGTMASTLGKLNPFRYRGYVYDEETGLYYLRSRYYSYAQNRLISADIALFSPTALIHNNLYTYCLNNPSARKDMDGREAVSAYLISAASFLFFEWLCTCITKAYQRAHTLSFPAASSIPTSIAQAHTSPSTKDSDRILDSSATNINYKDVLEHGTYYIACAAGNRLYIDDTPLGFLDALVAVGVTSITNGIAENLIQLNTKYTPDFNSSPKATQDFIRFYSSQTIQWGLYTEDHAAAEGMACILGWLKSPEFSTKLLTGYYHYHDASRKIHIWYGHQY